jgi:competence protein ComEC
VGEGNDRLSCDPFGCVVVARGQVVALARHPRALEEDCRVATVVIASFTLLRDCAGPTHVIDRRVLAREGAHGLWLDADGVRVQSVRATRGDRPWVARPATPPSRAPVTERSTHPAVSHAVNDSGESTP